MRRGDVRWCQFGPPDKVRPVVILTRTSAIGYLSSITVAPVTSTIRRMSSEVPLSEEDGLRTVCVANLDDIQTVRKARIGRYITTLAPSKLRELREAIEFALGLDELLQG